MGKRLAKLGNARASLRWYRAEVVSTLIYPRVFKRWGKSSTMVRPLRLVRADQISVGEAVAIYEGAWLACVTDAGRIRIADDVYLGHRCHLHAADFINIGQGCVFGDNVTVLDSRHKPGNLDTIEALRGGIEIGAGVHIGVNSVILGGVTIGDQAVIGANSVVNKNVPPRGRWVGDRLLDQPWT